MNPQPKQQPDDTLLQRFVDGELSRRQQQRVLADMDKGPDGWRRLALAFVEEQIWRQAYCDAGRRADAAEAMVVPRRSSPVRGGMLLVLVASLFAAWVLGLWQGRADQGAGPRPLEVAEGKLPPANQGYVHGPGPRPVEPGTGSESQPGMLRLCFANTAGGKDGTIDVPLVDLSSRDGGQYSYREFALPENVKQALSRSGYRINRRTDVFPLVLEDGRQVVLPVDCVEVQHQACIWYP